MNLLTERRTNDVRTARSRSPRLVEAQRSVLRISTANTVGQAGEGVKPGMRYAWGMTFVDTLAAERAVAIIRTREQRLAADAMDAAIRGGFRIVEFTLGTPGALELIATFAGRDGL